MFNESNQKQEPEDMFGDQNVVGQNQPQSQNVPGNSQMNQPQAQPAQPVQPTNVNAMEQQSQRLNQMEQDLMGGRAQNTGGGSNKTLVTILVVVAVLVLLGGGYWVYTQYLTPTSQSDVLEKETTQETTEQQQVETTENVEPEVVETINVQVPTDTDRDGLTDEEEEALGTKINHSDSDRDGLNDASEVNIYKTNPLLEDTDGDGFGDGEEVVNNYDPTDPTPGKRLYSVEEEVDSQPKDIK